MCVGGTTFSWWWERHKDLKRVCLAKAAGVCVYTIEVAWPWAACKEAARWMEMTRKILKKKNKISLVISSYTPASGGGRWSSLVEDRILKRRALNKV